MKFWEAMRELDRGEKVRVCHWGQDTYIHISTRGMIQFGGGLECDDLQVYNGVEWEFYKEPVKESRDMNFWEALDWLVDGEKIRAQFWAEGEYVHIVDGTVRNDDGSHWGLFNRQLSKVTWERYQEPVEKPSEKGSWVERGQKVGRLREEIEERLATYEAKLEELGCYPRRSRGSDR